MQELESGLALLGVGAQQRVDLGLHHLGDATDRFVLVLFGREISVVAEVAIQPLQGERQQRQRIGAFGGVGQQPLHQRGFDDQSPTGGGGAPGRAGDHLGVPGRAASV